MSESRCGKIAGAPRKIAPLVVTAGRATDVPAFHAEWFMRRLREGHCIWENPFNRTQRQYVSFEKCRVFVFWTKNPRPLIPFLREIEARGYQYYFQYTLNDYEKEGIEPRLQQFVRRCAVFRDLSERIGKERVVWRVDPIMLGGALSIDHMLEKIQRTADAVAPYTEKLAFSFVDWYKKTERALRKIDPSLRPPAESEMNRLAEGVAAINAALPRPLRLATCAERLDFQHLGIERNKCVDPVLLARLCPGSAELRTYCAQSGIQARAGLVPLTMPRVKNPGARPYCGCAPSKDVGGYNSCMHLCAYCYANLSEKAVIDKMRSLDVGSETL